MGTDEQIADLAAKYRRRELWSARETALLELILEEFGEAREKFDHYMANPDEVMAALKVGARKARPVAAATLGRVRTKLGF